MRPSIYLAGPMNGFKYEKARAWRQYVVRRMPDVEWLDPMRGLEPLTGQKLSTEAGELGPVGEGRASMVRDLHDIRRSDAVLSNLLGARKVSIGTMIEYGWANSVNIPIISVMESEGNVHDHPFVHFTSIYRVPTLDEALELLSVWFNVAVDPSPP